MAQGDWRFCTKCNSLFFNGFQNNDVPNPTGVCPSDQRGHNAVGFNFQLDFVDLPNDAPDPDDTPAAQSHWRFCTKCNVMFFAGSAPQDRHCAQGGAHTELGLRFMLPINRLGGPVLNPETPIAQSSWRFCGKCTSMVFKGFPNPNDPSAPPDPDSDANKGVCPLDGGAHAAVGDTFVLPHDNAPSVGIKSDGSTATVDGRGFVPNGTVEVGHEVQAQEPDGPITTNKGTDQVTTDNDGDFEFVFPLELTGQIIEVAVTATDDFTGLSASGQV